MKLIGSDGISVTFTDQAIKCSKTLTEMKAAALALDGVSSGEAEDDPAKMDKSSAEVSEEPLPLPKVRGDVLKKILKFSLHHADYYALPPEERERKELQKEVAFDAWDLSFFAENDSILFELALAANFLEVTKLFRMACKLVAMDVVNLSVEQVREKRGIINDLDPELEERIKLENGMLK